VGAVRRYDAVIFDYGGVLSVSPFGRMRESEHLLGLAPGTLSELFGYGPDQPEPASGEPYTNKWHMLEIGAIDVKEYADWVADRSVAVFGQRLELHDRLVGSVDNLTTYWLMVHTARDLKHDGYRTAICTNNIAAIRDAWMQQLPLDVFDVVVDSSVEGVRKPDPAIYRTTADRLGVPPARCVFLDDIPSNVEAARAVGMAGVLVGDDIVAALTELSELLREH